MLTPAQAADLIAKHAPSMPTAPVALRDAPGCVLRQDVRAERDQPPFDRVAMDGIALNSAKFQRAMRIVGTQPAGAPPLTLNDDNCIESMTGAMLPNGCDCVIPVERIAVKDGLATLADDVAPAPWLNIHRRGIDSRAGDLLLSAGAVLNAPEVAVLASSGLAHVHVARAPRIVVISTGDELVEPGHALDAWQIRRSNVYGILATLRHHGYTRLADDHIPDDRAQLSARLEKHLRDADLLILSGGVSMGKFDFVPAVLKELGVREIFHKIAQRPGKPMWFGVHDAGKAVYALPGNPVSTLACTARYVLPALRRTQGASPADQAVQLAVDCGALPTLATLLPVRLQAAPGAALAHPRLTHGSGDFTSLIGTDGCVELPPGEGVIPARTVVKFYPW